MEKLICIVTVMIPPQLPIWAPRSDSVLPRAFIGPIMCPHLYVAFSFQSVTYFPPQAFTVCDVTCLPPLPVHPLKKMVYHP